MIEFHLDSHQFIELNKLLKILNFAETGGEANYLITEGLVFVNGIVELQKRKKLRVDDIVEFEKQKIIRK